MSISHSDFYAQALTLAGGSSEISWRASISRAYYGAYHLANIHSHFCPSADSINGGVHAQLIKRFSLHNTIDSKAIAQALTLMKRLRSNADYELDMPMVQQFAYDQIHTYGAFSRRMISFANTLPK